MSFVIVVVSSKELKTSIVVPLVLILSMICQVVANGRARSRWRCLALSNSPSNRPSNRPSASNRFAKAHAALVRQVSVRPSESSITIQTNPIHAAAEGSAEGSAPAETEATASLFNRHTNPQQPNPQPNQGGRPQNRTTSLGSGSGLSRLNSRTKSGLTSKEKEERATLVKTTLEMELQEFSIEKKPLNKLLRYYLPVMIVCD